MLFYIGISLEGDLVRVAILKKEKGGVSIESLHEWPQTPSDVKQFYTLPPFQTKNRALIASSLFPEDLLVRKFYLPFSQKRQIAKALPFQLESVLPSITSSSVVLAQIKKESSKSSVITVFVSTKEKIAAHLDRLQTLGISSDQVSAPQVALFRFVRFAFPGEKKVICLDVKGENITCCVIDDQEIVIAQTLLRENPAALIEKLKFFLQQKGIAEGEVPWICMGDPFCKELEAALQERKLESSLAKDALAIGLALDAASRDGMNVQFCQGELIPSFMAKQRSFRLSLYAGSLLFASALLFLGGEVCINQKSKQISQMVGHYFPHQETSHSKEAIQDLFVKWESSLKGKKTPLNLVPTVPKVSEVLSYLSSHPSLTSDTGDAREGAEIQSFSYKLTKYPRIGQMNEPYLAQVDISIKSPSQKVAKEFHEALMKTDPLVNHKKEIKWHQEGSLYHTSFELIKKGSP